MKIVLLASVPHTGTNWLLEVLRKHGDFGHVVQTTALVKTVSYQARVDYTPTPRGLQPDTRNLIWGHFRESEKQLMFGLAAAGCPVVVPMRDPLLVLCSTRNHWPGGEGDEWFFEAWRLWAAMDDWRPRYVPVDGELSEPLRQLFEDLSQFPSEAMIEEKVEAAFATSPVNAQGEYTLRTLYDADDRQGLWDTIGPTLFDRLRALEPLLRPILERIGYRGLMWWS